MTGSPLLSTPRSFLFTAHANEPVYGIRLGFRNITGNESCAGAGRQPRYFLDVVDTGERRVMFLFSNREQDASSITDIFFNDAELFSISVQIKPITDVRENPSPAIPCLTTDHHYVPEPYHDSTSFQFIKSGLIAVDPDTTHCGINRDESLGIVFNLQAGVTLADIICALGNKELNIGIKVRGDQPDACSILINEPTLNASPSLHQQKAG
jgi:hypothetical protein